MTPSSSAKTHHSKKKRRFKLDRFRLSFTIALGIASAAAVALGGFKNFENGWLDRMHRWRGMRRADPRIVIVAIDDRSIEELGQFPWPRGDYAPLLRNLKALGAKVIGFDVLFLDPSRPDQDRALAEATSSAGNVVHAADLDEQEINQDLTHLHFRYPIEVLRKAALATGLVYTGFLPDGDGAVRRVPLMVGARRDAGVESFLDRQALLSDPARIASFGAAVLAAYQGASPDALLQRRPPAIRLNIAGERGWQEPHPSGAKVKGKPLMVEKREFGFARVSAIDIVRGTLKPEDRERLKGSIALIGSTAVGAYDHYPTPFSELTPGVEVHANLIDNLLQGNDLRPLIAGLDLAAPLLMIVLATSLIRLSPLAGGLAAAGIVLAWFGLSYALFLRSRLVAFVAPVATLGTCYFVLLLQRLLHEQKEKRWIKGTFGQYLSPKVVDHLIDDPEKLKLGGEKRDMSVFFIDIAHFTTISEKMDPEALTHFLNLFLTALTNVILKHDGVVDKYIGDCIMAFWNAPFDQPRHRELACRTAVECLQAVDKLNEELVGNGLAEKIAIRVGINSGSLVVGNMGSNTRFSYTVIGDTVNLASRLEGANKVFGTSIMASEAAFEGLKDSFEARPLGRLRVVGKKVPIKVYEICGLKEELPSEKMEALDLFEAAYSLYEQRQFAEAARQFERVLHLMPEDRAAGYYLTEARRLSESAPGPEWDGVVGLTSK